jgi:hypothetical protein
MNPNQTGAIIFSWSGIQPGREGKSLQVFGNAGQYYEELEKEGRITGTRVYLGLTGSNAGQYVVEGNLRSLLELMTDDEFVRLAQQATLHTQDFTMNVYAGGSADSLAEGMGNFITLLQEEGVL